MRLTDIAPFGWSEVHVFVPYSCTPDIREVLAFDWSPIRPIEEGFACVLENWDAFMLVFVDDESDTVVAWTQTSIADPKPLFGHDHFPAISLHRSDACLEVVSIDSDTVSTVLLRPIACN